MQCEFCNERITGYYYEVRDITNPDGVVVWDMYKSLVSSILPPLILGPCCVAPMKKQGYTLTTIEHPVPAYKKGSMTAEEIDNEINRK